MRAVTHAGRAVATLPAPCDRPLVIDVDGTLLQTDLLIEGVLDLIRRNPLIVFVLPLWLLKGKASFKSRIAARASLDVGNLPYNSELLRYLHCSHDAGRSLVLATASNIRHAEQIADHLQLFDRVFASTASLNLSGGAKRDMLVEAFGRKRFDYAGNSAADLPVWADAAQAIVVNPEAGIEHRAREVATVERVLETRTSPVRTYARALRLHQWLKNLLVFVPLIAAQEFGNPQQLFLSVLAFVSFGLCASSVYLANDMLDLPFDRRHSSKSSRPLAAGDMSLKHALVLMPVLLLLATMLALMANPIFAAVLATYYVTTLAYSLHLKKAIMIDVITLAALYTLRIIAGAAAISVVPSFWLLAFSMFIFVSLAVVKRYSELLRLHCEGGENCLGRGYRVTDLATLLSLGTASGYSAVIVLALYINSSAISAAYTRPEAVWMVCPLVLYWINRIWVLAGRGKVDDDPILFALRDRRSLWVLLLATVIVAVAI
jgi:4-hydroxybenzoate polyprenyltransferase/phosphoserine phosphatase